MIKVILTLYIFSAAIVIGLMTEDKVILGACLAASDGAGMFGFYFISQHAKNICKGGEND